MTDAIAASLLAAPAMARMQEQPMPAANWLFVQVADTATIEATSRC